RVTEINPASDGTWVVTTDRGTLRADHIVNAAGLGAREVGRMTGLALPVMAMEDQNLIIERIPGGAQSNTAMLHMDDFVGVISMSQEGKGMLLGTYEREGVPWSEHETPRDFSLELLPPDLDRIAASLEVGFRHSPPIERAGIKKIINGPFTFAPD